MATGGYRLQAQPDGYVGADTVTEKSNRMFLGFLEKMLPNVMKKYRFNGMINSIFKLYGWRRYLMD